MTGLPGRWRAILIVIGQLAVAVLPTLVGITGAVYLHPDALAAGFRAAALISGATCAAGGLRAAFTISNPERVARPAGAPCPRNASTAASTGHH